VPAAARQTDRNVPHCSGHSMATGSENVFINGLPACRVGDITTFHLRPGGRFCPPHSATVARGSSSVFINGRPAARVGDSIGGCTSIAQGSADVIIGG
jgi:uncharacterized Zn-binding protein involved in type VI secretion